MKKNKIIIVRPHGYTGGTVVLDLLCKLLREHGWDARLFYYYHGTIDDNNRFCLWNWTKMTIKHIVYYLFKDYFDKSNTNRAKTYRQTFYQTMTGLKMQLNPFFSRKTYIVLYPDVIYGNFLKAPKVVRWFLFHNRYKDMPNAYGKNDLFISYRKYFNDYNLNPEERNVQLTYFNRNLYKQYNFGERKGNCYIIRKGHNRTDLPNSFDGPVIDFGMDEEEIVRILNTSKYCYSYDTQTFYSTIAAVCGCISIVVCEPGKSKTDYLSPEECKNSVGIAYGDSQEELEQAVNTREQLLARLDYTIPNEENILLFIQYANEFFAY
jgi:hypothetical protein